MADTGTLTIRLPKDYIDRLNALAERTGRSRSLLAGEALVAYLAAQEWQVDAIREAVEAADSGATPVEHSAVAAWLSTWGSESESPRPPVRVVWFPVALDDLERLRAIIAEESAGRAEVVAHRILDAVEALADFPEQGRSGRVPGTRELVVPRTPYIVAYRVRVAAVEILIEVHDTGAGPGRVSLGDRDRRPGSDDAEHQRRGERAQRQAERLAPAGATQPAQGWKLQGTHRSRLPGG